MEEMSSLEFAKNLSVIFGVIIAALTLLKAVFEYSRQGKQKRAEHFLELRSRETENKIFNKIRLMLDHDKAKIAELTRIEKEEFLAFNEEIALMMYSGLINKHATYYMFGYYVILCWESDLFWSDIERGDEYWSVYKRFSLEMLKIQKNKLFKVKKVKL
jgi:hypothetical protein